MEYVSNRGSFAGQFLPEIFELNLEGAAPSAPGVTGVGESELDLHLADKRVISHEDHRGARARGRKSLPYDLAV